MPMDRLDEIVVGEVARRVLEPNRLGEMLQAYVGAGSDREDQNRERLVKLRHAYKEAEAAIARLLELVERGLMDAEDPALRERLIGLKLRRAESTKDAGDLQRHIASGEPEITVDKIGKVAVLLRDKLRHGSPELRQAYARS
jgi:site-specific DNA recombinase